MKTRIHALSQKTFNKIRINLQRGKNNFTVEKPGRHDLNQAIRVNIIINGTNENVCHLVGCNEKNTAPCP